MKCQWMTSSVCSTERSEKHPTPCRWLEFQIVVFREVRLSVRKVFVQVDDQSSDTLTTFLSKLNALTGIVAACIMMRFVVHPRLVPDNLNIFAVLYRYTCKLGRFRDNLLGHRTTSFERGRFTCSIHCHIFAWTVGRVLCTSREMRLALAYSVLTLVHGENRRNYTGRIPFCINRGVIENHTRQNSLILRHPVPCRTSRSRDRK